MVQPDAMAIKRARGVIIELLYGRHAEQMSRVDHVTLWASLVRMGCDIGENAAITLLQDLGDRNYVKYEQKKNRLTNRTEINLIQLTARGRDLYERTIEDPAVLL
jgi:hypothetical protein